MILFHFRKFKSSDCLTFLLILLMLMADNHLFAQIVNKEVLAKHRQQANKIGKISDLRLSSLYADSLMRLAKAGGDKSWEAQIMLAKAGKSYKNGDQDKALQFGRVSAALALQADSVTYIRAPLMVAFMLNRQGKDDQALKIAFEMMRKADQLGWKRMAIECRNCVADIYRSIHEAEKALPYAQQSAKDALELKDTAMYIYSLSTLSNIFSTEARDNPAKLLKATAYAEQILSKPLVASLSDFDKTRYLTNLGRLYEMLKKYKRAEELLTQSVAISRKEGFTDLEKAALNELMTVNLNQGQYGEAIGYGQQALRLLPDAASSQMLQRNIYDRLSDANLALRNYQQAFYYTTKARTINDSLMSQEKARLAAEMDLVYKSDKHIIEANANAKLMTQQRNFIIALTIVSAIALFALYQWILFKKNKKAERLATKHRQLAKLDEMKTKFFSNISHELRSPLTLIVGPIDQLRNHEQYQLSAEQQRGYIETIWLNSRKLLTMFNELLDLSKIESGSLPLKLQNMEVRSLINLFYQGFASSAEFKKIHFMLTCGFEPGTTARIDRDKLEKIVNNLISNALKFTPAHGSVSMLANPRPFGLEIILTDTGAGIAQEELDHIFERYYQVETKSNSAEGGTGIGLAIAKEYTEILGGRITVESTPGKGTSFTVFIPMAFQLDPKWKEEMPAANQLVVTDAAQLNVNPGGLILLVEDQLDMAEYVSSVLNPFYKVEVAINGVDALEKLALFDELPALIISDVMMPGMDGIELLTHLKQHETYCRIPVVMLTAVADSRSRLHALNIGVDDYLTKPFVRSELLARAANLINNALARLQYSVDQEIAVIPENGEAALVLQVSPADLLWLNKLEDLVRSSHNRGDLELASISFHMAISERQLYRTIKSITGLTPNKYIRSIRLQIAREAIESGRYRTVAEISHAAGFDTPAYFSKLFKESFGRDVIDLL